MASERETSCATAHASSAATVIGSNRAGMVSPNFTPAGRPLDFLCTVFDCVAMIIRVHEKRAGGKDLGLRHHNEPKMTDSAHTGSYLDPIFSVIEAHKSAAALEAVMAGAPTAVID
jgi:hypothetical protein